MYKRGCDLYQIYLTVVYLIKIALINLKTYRQSTMCAPIKEKGGNLPEMVNSHFFFIMRGIK